MADASLPDIRARSRPGTAIAAMMPIIATTVTHANLKAAANGRQESRTWALTQVVFLHVIPERPEAHPEQLGRLHLHAARTFERLGDISPLYIFDVCFEVEA